MEDLRVLLIEDDEDDYLLVRSLLEQIPLSSFALTWEQTYEGAFRRMSEMDFDLFLLDYRLGAHSGLEFLHQAAQRDCQAPIIVLTGQGDYQVDVEAMKAGAADYLIKGQINAPLLERSIRYAIERQRNAQRLIESRQQLKHLSGELLRAQENERKLIAAELHDNLGQILTAVKFGVENSLALMQKEIATPQHLEGLIPTIQYAIEEVRRIYTHLRPSLLDDLGLVATITWFCREYEKLHPRIEIDQDIRVQECEIPENLKLVIYRILQESLNNIAKHSKAELVRIALARANGSLELLIEDNGMGFDLESKVSTPSANRGLGLASMKERTELSGGRFSLSSIQDEGTTIRAEWPVS